VVAINAIGVGRQVVEGDQGGWLIAGLSGARGRHRADAGTRDTRGGPENTAVSRISLRWCPWQLKAESLDVRTTGYPHRLNPRSWVVTELSASWVLSPLPWSRSAFGPVAHSTHPESRIAGSASRGPHTTPRSVQSDGLAAMAPFQVSVRPLAAMSRIVTRTSAV
jgi:hypothetical protein